MKEKKLKWNKQAHHGIKKKKQTKCKKDLFRKNYMKFTMQKIKVEYFLKRRNKVKEKRDQNGIKFPS